MLCRLLVLSRAIMFFDFELCCPLSLTPQTCIACKCVGSAYSQKGMTATREDREMEGKEIDY